MLLGTEPASCKLLRMYDRALDAVMTVTELAMLRRRLPPKASVRAGCLAPQASAEVQSGTLSTDTVTLSVASAALRLPACLLTSSFGSRRPRRLPLECM